MDATEIIFSVAGIAVAATVVWGIVRLANQHEKIDLRIWLGSAAAWFVWLADYWAWVAWRADAPEAKDASFAFVVAPIWFFSAVFIIATEFFRFRARPMGTGARITRAIMSSLFQIAALLIIAIFTGIYVHFAAGGNL